MPGSWRAPFRSGPAARSARERGGPAAREAPGLGEGSALEGGQKSSVPRTRLSQVGSVARVPARGTRGGDAPPPGPAVPYLFRVGTGLPEQVSLGRSRSLLAGGPEGFLGHRKVAGHRVHVADPARTVRAVQRAAWLHCLSGCMDRVGDRKAKEAVLGVLCFPSLLTKLFGCPQSWVVRARATAEPERPTAGRDSISLSSSKALAWLLPRSGPMSQRS